MEKCNRRRRRPTSARFWVTCKIVNRNKKDILPQRAFDLVFCRILPGHVLLAIFSPDFCRWRTNLHTGKLRFFLFLLLWPPWTMPSKVREQNFPLFFVVIVELGRFWIEIVFALSCLKAGYNELLRKFYYFFICFIAVSVNLCFVFFKHIFIWNNYWSAFLKKKIRRIY